MTENHSKIIGVNQCGFRVKNRVKRPIVSVKNWEDVKKVEEVEDCFILEFDPTKTHNGVNNNDGNDNDDDNDDDDDDVKIKGSLVCVKRREDVKKVEEFEDCFILDFDPCEESYSIGFMFSKLSVSVKSEVVVDDDDDVSILAVKGHAACRDYPHPRHLCGTHPFEKTSHEKHCKMCYCYVCDRPAPCKKWTTGCRDPTLKHCDATPENPFWKRRRDRKKLQSQKG